MIFHSIQDYLIARNNWEQTPMRITPDGKVFSCVDGNWLEGCNWDKPRYEYRCLDNPDKQNINTGVIPHKQR